MTLQLELQGHNRYCGLCYESMFTKMRARRVTGSDLNTDMSLTILVKTWNLDPLDWAGGQAKYGKPFRFLLL